MRPKWRTPSALAKSLKMMEAAKGMNLGGRVLATMGCGATTVVRSGRRNFGSAAKLGGICTWTVGRSEKGSFRSQYFLPQQEHSRSTKAGRRIPNFARYASSATCSHELGWLLLGLAARGIPNTRRVVVSSVKQDKYREKSNPPITFSSPKDPGRHSSRISAKKKKQAPKKIEATNGSGSNEPIQTEELVCDPSELTVICFDIETTGLSVRNDRIIEFAARDLAGGHCSTIETLVNPEREVRNAHIHKISNAMVRRPDVPRWTDVAPAILDFVESRQKGEGLVILVAHNGRRFDVPFIITEFHACGLSIPSFWRFVDSLTLARTAMKGSGIFPIPSTRLGQLFNYYNLQSVGTAHRAMADVNMLALVLQMLMNDLQMNTSQLLALSFGADAIVVKPRDDAKSLSVGEILLDVKVASKASLDRKRPVSKMHV